VHLTLADFQVFGIPETWRRTAAICRSRRPRRRRRPLQSPIAGENGNDATGSDRDNGFTSARFYFRR